MSNQELILYEVKNRIATITIDRPEKAHAFSIEMLQMMHSRLKEADEDTIDSFVKSQVYLNWGINEMSEGNFKSGEENIYKALNLFESLFDDHNILLVDYLEALHIEKVRNNFFTQLKKLIKNLTASQNCI